MTTSDRVEEETRAPKLVVGIGASAGGLQSLEKFFANMPEESGMAFVVIQHLSPDFKSMMAELIARQTNIPIHVAQEGMPVEADTIYLMPRRKEMIVSGGRLHLTDKDLSSGLTLPIDHFFRSLAQDYGWRSAAIVLSGSGSDGSRGIVDVHEASGLVLCENEQSAKFDGMPLSAQETGVVDLVVHAEDMPRLLLERVKSPLQKPSSSIASDGQPLEGIEAVFDLLRREYDIDFLHYKPTTVSRRIERRLTMVNATDFEDYVSRLRTDPEELHALYKDLLIGVTKFFRDSEAYDQLERHTIPELLARVPENEEIRVWSAGCATGEEAYSLAILFHEALERAKRPANLKVFATDVHRASLEHAGSGVFDNTGLSDVSPERLRKYFRRKEEGYQVSPDLRSLIVFARHNAIKDAPFTNLHFISCRNLLIYFQAPAQKKALSLFHFGLKTNGILWLGSSETPGELGSEFEAVDERTRIYRKRRDIRLPAELRLPLTRTSHSLRGPFAPSRSLDASQTQPLLSTYDVLLDKYMPPSLLINEHRELVESFGGAERLLRVRGRRPSRDLLDMLDTDARTAIAGALNRVMRHKQPVTFTGVHLSALGEENTYRLNIELVEDEKSRETFYLISLEPLEEPQERRPLTEVDADEMTRDQIRHLEDELRYNKENLQATIEELETSNEEMQATNEELVASNEELQSTNEELHSVNEELYTVNAEYQKKIEELAELNHDMEHLLMSTDVAIVFLDSELRIRKFTPPVAEIFDLVEQDLGRRIATFSHRIRHENLLEDLEAVLTGRDRRELEVRDHDGNCYFMRILPYDLGDRVDGVVLSLIDITVLDQARARISDLSAIVESSEDAIIGIDLEGTITSWNHGAEKLYGYDTSEVVGQDIRMLVPEDERSSVSQFIRKVANGESLDAQEVDRLTKDGTTVHVSLSLSPIRDAEGRVRGVSSISRDISIRKRAYETNAKLSAIVESSDDAIISKTLEGTITSWNSGAEKLYGYSADEMIGEHISRIVPEEKTEELGDIMGRLSTGASVKNLETTRVCQDGTRKEVSLTISPIRESSGEVTGASAIARDITELKTIQRAKESADRQMHLLLTSTAEAIYGLDNNGLCTFANPSCVRMLGYTSEQELLGRNMHALIHHHRKDGTPYQAESCVIYQAFVKGERVHLESDVMWRADGTAVPVEVWSYPMVDERGKIVGAVVTFLDITDRIEAVERLREEVRRREQFLAILSHELRNPLNAVVNAVRVLETASQKPENSQQAVGVISRQSDHMARLLDDLLDASRVTSDKIEMRFAPCDLREACQSALEATEPSLGRHEHDVQVELPGTPIPVSGDRARLIQVIENLLTNAAKYTPDGGAIVLSLTTEQEEAVLRVRDNGAGIPPELQSTVFDMFVQCDETLHRAEGGIGVGLTLVQSLVRLHHGTVMVESDGPGKGSQFTVRLPLLRDEFLTFDESDQEETGQTAVSEGPTSVVLVEDQDDNREMLAELLQLQGCKVHTAADGRAGLEAIREHAPDVAIIDIGLPELDGYSVARSVREHHDHQPRLVALTGYGRQNDRRRVMEAGFDEHLVKPLKHDDIVRLLQPHNDRSTPGARSS